MGAGPLTGPHPLRAWWLGPLRRPRRCRMREAQISEFRKAAIEKTLGGLLWAAVVAIGYFALNFLKTHGFRP